MLIRKNLEDLGSNLRHPLIGNHLELEHSAIEAVLFPLSKHGSLGFVNGLRPTGADPGRFFFGGGGVIFSNFQALIYA